MRGWIVRAIIAVTFLSLTVPTAPQLWKNGKLALSLREHSWSRRREIVFGASYPALRQIREKIHPRADVALILGGGDDLAAGTFANYYLYPRNVITYWSLDNYEHDRVEGAQGRRRPDIIVWIDAKHSPVPRIVTVAEIRRTMEASK